ncbi:Six-hairpin glycosidase-like protein [Xylogone sp. PMI_703]|nr:Six-hairpin glycosidase-like protein [Xylogone sp. PMI_703]
MLRDHLLLHVFGALCLWDNAHAAQIEKPNSASHPLRIWSSAPSLYLNNSHVLGNGRIGAAPLGAVVTETINVNEDSLWSGGPLNRVNPDGAQTVSQMRDLVAQGRVPEALTLAQFGFVGTPVAQQHYDVLGYITMVMDHGSEYADYERWMDLGDSTSGVYYTVNGTAYSREYFASNPAGVVAIRVTSNSSAAVSLNLHLDRGAGLNRWQDYGTREGSDTIIMGGGSGGRNSIEFSAGLTAVASGGTVSTKGDYLLVDKADEVWIYFSTWTTYRTPNPRQKVLNDLESARAQTYSAIRAAHVADYKFYADRVSLNLGQSTPQQRAMNTTNRLAASKNTFDPELASLLFRFGRYILISTSRDGSLPPNLQGLWNTDIDSAWGSRYKLNIDVQIDYWLSLTANMPELVTPLHDLINILCQSGRTTARVMYNATGCVAHHQTDLWGDSAPEDNWPSSTWWPMGLTWLVTHAMEHYRFTGDADMLKQMYPSLEGVAQFATDFLSDYEGYKVTNPTISPENTYYLDSDSTVEASITLGPTIDNSMLWEVFGEIVEAQAALDMNDTDFVAEVTSLRAQLPPLRVNQYGGVSEWIKDYNETDPGHRHYSQLWGLLPGSQITASNQTLFEASKSSLHRRLKYASGAPSWWDAYSSIVAARVFDVDLVHSLLVHQLSNQTYGGSMLGVHPGGPFQPTGNLGVTASMAEALLQSHETISLTNTNKPTPAYTGDDNKAHLIRLLPVLPPEWAANGGGSVKGLLARGGFQVDISWDSKGRLRDANITSRVGNPVWITLGTTPVGETTNSTTNLAVKGCKTAAFVLLKAQKGSTHSVTIA